MAIGLTIVLNKYKNYFESKHLTFTFDTVKEAKKELVSQLINEYKNVNFDYPSELGDFEYLWFDQKYTNANAFSYKIFSDGRWSQPWEEQEIYNKVIDMIVDEESKIPIDYSELYGEPEPDESKEDKFTIESNEKIQEIEYKLKEILENSKNVHDNTEQVKECNCEKCLSQRE